ncbi:ATP-binding protein [Halonotius terrestris]|uniref:ATP-binding protein n=1 Tax=Halonotius terrestris TaxID=2487750 RepID=A0A8J8TC01_9EURY|nr:ATP-binding protein [Halonotius terrestris]TQQ79926.1 ATP-binding protein [Halonotius terrestris]
MSLKRSAQKSHLESEYKRYRKHAEAAREEGDPTKAARYYRQCVGVLEDLAELETNSRLATERKELAANLATAAERLESDQPLVDESGGAGGGGSSGGGSQTTTTTGSGDGDATSGTPGATGDADDGLDPTQFLEDPPERDFTDVGGMTDLKETLKDQVIDPLQRPELYEEYDLGVVNGVLLYGPPGTGKTYITEALAGELGYNVVIAQASDITSSLVGEAADNMAELFAIARNNQPCLLFLDEIDAIAAERSGDTNKTMSESQMITQFLTEMSETKGEDVVVVGATNLPDEIDGAAWRRFDERIEVPPPDATARAAVLRVHLRDRPVVTDAIEWDEIKDLTDGYAASDLEIIASKAARRALKEARDADEVVPISQTHLETAIEETESSLDAWDAA